MNNNTDISLSFKNSVSGLNKIEEYQKRLSSLKKVMNGMPTDLTLGKTINSTAKSVDNVSKSTKKLNNDLADTKKKLSVAFEYSVIRQFVLGMKSAVKETGKLITQSADYLENINLFQVAFNGAYQEAERFINKTSEMYGIDESQLTNMVGIFRQLSNAMNLSVETGNRLSTLLSQMAIDISSLYNLDIDKSSSVLQSSLAGQTKPIRGATGADITQQTLQTTLDTIGVDKYIADLSYAEKRLVIIISLTQQLNEATNDFGRTIESPANQIRILNEQFERLTRSVGNALLPMASKVLPYLNAIVMTLTEIINYIAILFGYSPDDFDYFSGTADSVLDLEEGLEGASESAKKLKQGLRGFDKLNVITTPTAGAGGAGLGNIDPAILNAFNKAYDDYLSKITDVEMKATKIRDRMMEWLGFAKRTNLITGDTFFEYQGIDKTLSNMWESFKGLSTSGKMLVGLGLVTGAVKLFNVGKKITTVLLGTKALQSLSTVIRYSKIMTGVTGSLTKGLADGAEMWYKNASGADKFQMSLVGLVALTAGVELINSSFESMAENGVTLGNVLTSVVGGLGSVAGGAITLGAVFGPIGAIIGAVGGALVALYQPFAQYKEFTESLKTSTTKYSETLSALRETTIKNVEVSMLQMERTKELSTELEGLIDSNGRVKQSDEERVNFILNQMNDAFGTEYQLIDGIIFKNGEQIQSYDQVKQSIDKMIESKRAELLLKAMEDEYIEVLKERKGIQDEIEEVQKRLTRQRETLTEIEEAGGKIGQTSYRDMAKAIEYNEEKLKQLTKTKEETNKQMLEYENLYKAKVNGNYEELNKLVDKYLGNTKENYKDLEKEVNTQSDVISKSLNKPFNDLNGKVCTFSLAVDTNGATRTLNEFGNKLNYSGLGQIYTGISFTPTYPYAEGGMPPVGQLFIANEEGPELVGQIGGKSFVANQNQMMDLLDKKIGSAGSPVNATFIVKVGDEEVARKVLYNLQDMAKSDGKPIEIG